MPPLENAVYFPSFNEIIRKTLSKADYSSSLNLPDLNKIKESALLV